MPPGFTYRFPSTRLGNYIRMTERTSFYDGWSRKELVQRLVELESSNPKSKPSGSGHQPNTDSSLSRARHLAPQSALELVRPKPIDFAALPRRKIALKFCYSGWEYGGVEFQQIPGPLPSVESVLFDALAYTALVDGSGGQAACGWERCGRTDKGVSSAGQVVSFWIRSRLPEFLPTAPLAPADVPTDAPAIADDAVINSDEGPGLEGELGFMADMETSAEPVPVVTSTPVEFNYVPMLNRVLPPTIRILAWSPVADDFSARFQCTHRHYKYFFHGADLNIRAMRDAASRLLGLNDFRNLCTLDPARQLTHFNRHILRADISPVSSSSDSGTATDMYVFDLMGTAFLFNQVRRIMAILFLVGAELEAPSVVTALLNTDPAKPTPPFREGEPTPPTVECMPHYTMADSLPLVLWECGYRDSDVHWMTHGDESEDETGASASKDPRGRLDLYSQMRTIHERSAIHTVLDDHFLAAAQRHHKPPPARYATMSGSGVQKRLACPMGVPRGGGFYERRATYVPLLARPRIEHFTVVNERYRTGKLARKVMRKAGAVTLADEDGGDKEGGDE